MGLLKAFTSCVNPDRVAPPNPHGRRKSTAPISKRMESTNISCGSTWGCCMSQPDASRQPGLLFRLVSRGDMGSLWQASADQAADAAEPLVISLEEFGLQPDGGSPWDFFLPHNSQAGCLSLLQGDTGSEWKELITSDPALLAAIREVIARCTSMVLGYQSILPSGVFTVEAALSFGGAPQHVLLAPCFAPTSHSQLIPGFMLEVAASNPGTLTSRLDASSAGATDPFTATVTASVAAPATATSTATATASVATPATATATATTTAAHIPPAELPPDISVLSGSALEARAAYRTTPAYCAAKPMPCAFMSTPGPAGPHEVTWQSGGKALSSSFITNTGAAKAHDDLWETVVNTLSSAMTIVDADTWTVVHQNQASKDYYGSLSLAPVCLPNFKLSGQAGDEGSCGARCVLAALSNVVISHLFKLQPSLLEDALGSITYGTCWKKVLQLDTYKASNTCAGDMSQAVESNGEGVEDQASMCLKVHHAMLSAQPPSTIDSRYSGSPPKLLTKSMSSDVNVRGGPLMRQLSTRVLSVMSRSQGSSMMDVHVASGNEVSLEDEYLEEFIPASARHAAQHVRNRKAVAAEEAQMDGRGLAQESRHEVLLLPLVSHLGSSQRLVLIKQEDVTAQTEEERMLVSYTELLFEMVGSMFPRHVLEYMVNNALEEDSKILQTGSELLASVKGSCLSLLYATAASIDAVARSHKDVSIMFMDIVGFTSMSKQVPAAEVMKYLNKLFTLFDQMVDQYHVYKVETAGDCYIVAGGLAHVDQEGMVTLYEEVDPRVGAQRVVAFSWALIEAAETVLMPHDHSPTRIRVGIHTGDVTSGVIGTKLPKYSIFGDTMNTASRMESTCPMQQVQISSATYSLITGCTSGTSPTSTSSISKALLYENPHEYLPMLMQSVFEAREPIEVKGKGMMETFLCNPSSLATLHPELHMTSPMMISLLDIMDSGRGQVMRSPKALPLLASLLTMGSPNGISRCSTPRPSTSTSGSP